MHDWWDVHISGTCECMSGAKNWIMVIRNITHSMGSNNTVLNINNKNLYNGVHLKAMSPVDKCIKVILKANEQKTGSISPEPWWSSAAAPGLTCKSGCRSPSGSTAGGCWRCPRDQTSRPRRPGWSPTCPLAPAPPRTCTAGRSRSPCDPPPPPGEVESSRHSH